MSGSRPAPGIIVINPNSSRAVTAGMDRAIETLRRPDGPAIRCVTLAEGPPGIETDAQVREVVAPLLRLVRRMDGEASAFVDACFSDPGLMELRQTTATPVFGIGECAYRRASGEGRRFGVISILEASLPRHRRTIEDLGLVPLLAGDRPIGLGVTTLGDDAEATLGRLVQVGEQLRDTDGAEVIVLGCTGMTRHRDPLQSALGVPVVDPVRAAVEAAVDAVTPP
ncbi:MAG: aspartate/glutamate racemase family protein [Alphaproteobacteria bacterium]